MLINWQQPNAYQGNLDICIDRQWSRNRKSRSLQQVEACFACVDGRGRWIYNVDGGVGWKVLKDAWTGIDDELDERTVQQSCSHHKGHNLGSLGISNEFWKIPP